jgi:hypothetical protein
VQRAFGVIFLRRRCPEGGHDRVPYELFDRSAGVVDFGRHRVVEAIEERSRPLWILRGAELGRADEVGENDRGELAFLAGLAALA